jgi:hypothetical protein
MCLPQDNDAVYNIKSRSKSVHAKALHATREAQGAPDERPTSKALNPDQYGALRDAMFDRGSSRTAVPQTSLPVMAYIIIADVLMDRLGASLMGVTDAGLLAPGTSHNVYSASRAVQNIH